MLKNGKMRQFAEKTPKGLIGGDANSIADNHA
jgi:hypothetical protein